MEERMTREELINHMVDISNTRYENLKRCGGSRERIGMDDFLKPVFKEIADFIIADRKRIVEPLVKFKSDMGDDAYDWKFRRLVPTEYIDATIKNAMIEE